MSVSQKVIKETAEMLKAEWELQYNRGMSAAIDSKESIEAKTCMDMTEYFARQIAAIFKTDNPAFDEKKFYNLCGMDWLI